MALLALLLCLGLALGCGHSTGMKSKANSDQTLPFGREPDTFGFSPSRWFLPSVARLPEGTTLVISVDYALSSAYARARDRFTATLAEPITINGETVVPRGALLSGRVLDAKRAGPRDPGYLRISLETLRVDGRQVPIATSSLFVKGGAHEERSPAAILKDGAGAAPPARMPEEAIITPERRLSFGLMQKVDLL